MFWIMEMLTLIMEHLAWGQFIELHGLTWNIHQAL